jgi:hypothetical protein
MAARSSLMARMTPRSPGPSSDSTWIRPGSEPTLLHDGADGVPTVKPVAPPDGTSLVVVCGHATDDLCLMDADGHDLRLLVDDPPTHENHRAWGVVSSWCCGDVSAIRAVGHPGVTRERVEPDEAGTGLPS